MASGATGDSGNERIEGTIIRFSEHEFTVQLDSGWFNKPLT